jgi:nicotinate-nucleotide adenylyltransferase
MAQEARLVFGLDTVMFIPAGNPPHKTGKTVTDAERRYEMCKLATESNPHFTVSRMEIDKGGISYTIDTVREIKALYPESEIYFIIGADSVFELESWKNAAELLASCSFIAATREGVKGQKSEIKRLRRKYGTKMDMLEIPGVKVSSTDMRRRVKAGASLRYLTPVKVAKYIAAKGLYKQTEPLYSAEQLSGKISGLLSEKRHRHVVGTAECAVRLAQVYGQDTEKAYVAAMLHDCGRALNGGEMLAYCEQNGIVLDEYMLTDINPVHAEIGAYMAQKNFGVTDKKILNAIKRHTIGRKRMTPLDKIIFVADAIEPNRPETDVVAETRAIAETDLDRAVILSLYIKTAYLRESSGTPHPNSLNMIKYLEKKIAGKTRNNSQRRMNNGESI